MDVQTIGERLSWARKRAGLSTRDLAALAGFPASNGDVSRIERGKQPRPSGLKLAAYARVLRVRVEWLMSGDEPLDAPPEGRGPNDPPSYLARPLSDVATELQTRGLLLFASTDPAGAGLTLGEALRGLEHLREQPALSNSSGVPVQGWAAFFEELRQPAKPVADRATEEARRRTIAIERGDVPAGTTSTMTSDMPGKRAGRRK